ncbi:hypothetical protein MNBD_GAMMA22-1911 [hydrothermal vent metagenome]|uniref:Uncharacterized protein n=1 Tax=hydrothermal vent metagenome TaxID=652676 RepID=A0A3B1A2B3_9ZZZZ
MVQPGLFPLTHNFGNKNQDNCIFQIDQTFSFYRQNKMDARAEQLNKYYCRDKFQNSTLEYITQYLLNNRITSSWISAFHHPKLLI